MPDEKKKRITEPWARQLPTIYSRKEMKQMGRHVESEIPGEALLNHTKDICKVTLLESVQETLHITTSRKHTWILNRETQ